MYELPADVIHKNFRRQQLMQVAPDAAGVLKNSDLVFFCNKPEGTCQTADPAPMIATLLSLAGILYCSGVVSRACSSEAFSRSFNETEPPLSFNMHTRPQGSPHKAITIPGNPTTCRYVLKAMLNLPCWSFPMKSLTSRLNGHSAVQKAGSF